MKDRRRTGRFARVACLLFSEEIAEVRIGHDLHRKLTLESGI